MTTYDKERRYYMKVERVYNVEVEDNMSLETFIRRDRNTAVIGNKTTRVLTDLSRLWFRLGDRRTGPEFINLKLGNISLNTPHPDNSLEPVWAETIHRLQTIILSKLIILNYALIDLC